MKEGCQEGNEDWIGSEIGLNESNEGVKGWCMTDLEASLSFLFIIHLLQPSAHLGRGVGGGGGYSNR